MARTHHGSLYMPVETAAGFESKRRRLQPQVCTGNYCTFRLYNHKAVANNDTRVLQDRVFLPMPFRISAIATDTLGATATVTVFVDNSATGSTLISGGQVVSDNTQHQVLPAGLVPGTRNIARAGSLDLTISANGTGASPIGSIIVWVTGYFTDWISQDRKQDEPGNAQDAYGAAGGPPTNKLLHVTRYSGPVAGYFDNFAMFNLRANANQSSLRQECAVTVPYDCRMVAMFTGRTGTNLATGSAVLQIDNSAVGTIKSMDFDALGAYAVLDYPPDTITEGMDPTNAAVELRQGQKIAISFSTGVADSIPIGFGTVHAIVWVKGHVAPNDHKELD